MLMYLQIFSRVQGKKDDDDEEEEEEEEEGSDDDESEYCGLSFVCGTVL